MLKPTPLSPHLAENLNALREPLRGCSDVVFREFAIAGGLPAALVFLDGLAESRALEDEVLKPLMQAAPEAVLGNARRPAAAGLRELLWRAVPLPEVGEVTRLDQAVAAVLDGDSLLLVEGMPGAFKLSARGWEERAVEEPDTEAVIRGPKEGFTENLRTNMAMLRRKLKTHRLKLERLQVGRLSRTAVALAYVEGLVRPELAAELRSRIERIDIDGVLESGYVEEFIEDHPFSPFPQVQNTQRPDVVAANLLEGRVAILVDGTPVVLLAPATFWQFLQINEDYYERFGIAVALRLLRYLLVLVSLLGPSLYIAVTTFHQELLPSPLLLSIAAAREGVPFPAFVEALIMEVTFEALREAGLRLPRPVGQAVSIVGALVIGQAAVQAGIVSAPMVIVVAITGIASFTSPHYNAGIAIRLLRFPIMALAASLGLFGIINGLALIIVHLCRLHSFGTPYLAPVAPAVYGDLKDVAIRAPWWAMLRRPGVPGTPDRQRVGAGKVARQVRGDGGTGGG